MKGLIYLTTAIFVVSVHASSIHLSPKGLDGRSVSDSRSPGTRARESLMKTLLENYFKIVKPEPYDGSPLQVNMSLNLINIDRVDTKEMILETRALVWMTWRDERLSWYPSDFYQVNRLHIPANLIWIPDIDLLNNDEDAEKPMSDPIANVTSDGLVVYVRELHLKSFCETGQEASKASRIARLLGFSEIVCKLMFASWTYDATEIELVTPTSQIDLTYFRRVSTDEFTVKRTSVEVDQHTIKCCPYPHPIATFIIVLSKNPKYSYDTK